MILFNFYVIFSFESLSSMILVGKESEDDGRKSVFLPIFLCSKIVPLPLEFCETGFIFSFGSRRAVRFWPKIFLTHFFGKLWPTYLSVFLPVCRLWEIDVPSNFISVCKTWVSVCPKVAGPSVYRLILHLYKKCKIWPW